MASGCLRKAGRISAGRMPPDSTKILRTDEWCRSNNFAIWCSDSPRCHRSHISPFWLSVYRIRVLRFIRNTPAAQAASYVLRRSYETTTLSGHYKSSPLHNRLLGRAPPFSTASSTIFVSCSRTSSIQRRAFSREQLSPMYLASVPERVYSLSFPTAARSDGSNENGITPTRISEAAPASPIMARWSGGTFLGRAVAPSQVRLPIVCAG